MASFTPASGVWTEDYDEFGNVVRYVYNLVCRYTISTKLLRILLPVPSEVLLGDYLACYAKET